MLKVMIVDNEIKRSKPLKQSLIDNGFEVIAHVENDMHLQSKCFELKPDIVIIDTDSPNRDTLENICVMSMHDPRPVIDAAIARFEEFKSLRSELTLAKSKLDERKIVERAKGLLMKQRGLDEEDAYEMLRSMAMKKNMKLADLSHQLMEAASMLIA